MDFELIVVGGGAGGIAAARAGVQRGTHSARAGRADRRRLHGGSRRQHRELLSNFPQALSHVGPVTPPGR
ncbi:MAG: hypothetical protein ACRDY6_23475 [Acidimicrobiia bacterium]